MALAGQVAKQATECCQIYPPGGIRQWGILYGKTATPAEQMRIAAQLGELDYLWEILLKIGEEAIDGRPIISVGTPEDLSGCPA
jgi:hypothetical protein